MFFENIFFFVNNQGNKLKYYVVQRFFIKISVQIGLRKKGSNKGPRIHDLRHTMVVATIVRWYKDDLNVDSYIPILSTYLGHSHPSYTYWYLTGTPELLGVVLSRLKKYQ